MKMNFYTLNELLSKEAMKFLPQVLDEMGYSGRYTITDNFGGATTVLEINSNYTVVEKAYKKAEELAHGCAGRLIQVKQTTFSSVWVPESEAETLNDAYQVAIKKAKTEQLPVSNSHLEFCSVEDPDYHDEFSLCIFAKKRG